FAQRSAPAARAGGHPGNARARGRQPRRGRRAPGDQRGDALPPPLRPPDPRL
ncbi:MAG: hypothetical protein AVDCRST_MAG89-740, partial [uncultured Gemmatimonadetes bacterium]